MSSFLLFFPFLLLSGGSSTVSSAVDCSGDDLNSVASLSSPVRVAVKIQTSSSYPTSMPLGSTMDLPAHEIKWQGADIAISSYIKELPSYEHVSILQELMYGTTKDPTPTRYFCVRVQRRTLSWLWRLTIRTPTQDLIHVFSSVPRDLNFIDHTSDLG